MASSSNLTIQSTSFVSARTRLCSSVSNPSLSVFACPSLSKPRNLSLSVHSMGSSTSSPKPDNVQGSSTSKFNPFFSIFFPLIIKAKMVSFFVGFGISDENWFGFIQSPKVMFWFFFFLGTEEVSFGRNRVKNLLANLNALHVSKQYLRFEKVLILWWVQRLTRVTLLL